MGTLKPIGNIPNHWTFRLSVLIWWKDPNNVLVRYPLHTEEHNLLLFTDVSVNGWGA